MELVKQREPLELTWKDITFMIKATATAGDKFILTTSAPVGADGKQIWNMNAFYRKLIDMFVIGWKGVTEDGKDVPFSMDAMALLPADPTEDVFVRLGSFIGQKTGILDIGGERKNGSGQP